MPGPAFNLQAVQILNTVYSASSGGSSTGVDISPAIGPITMLISDRTGGTAAATITVEHSAVLGSGYTTVPASAITTVPNGVATPFDNLGTTVYAEVRQINRQQLQQFLRITIAGTTITHNVAASIAYAVENTGEIV